MFRVLAVGLKVFVLELLLTCTLAVMDAKLLVFIMRWVFFLLIILALPFIPSCSFVMVGVRSMMSLVHLVASSVSNLSLCS